MTGFSAREPVARGRNALCGLCWLALVFPAWGCQLALDVEEQQCQVDADCVGLFGREYVCTAERVCVAEDANTPAPSTDAGSERPAAWACLDEPRRMVIPRQGETVSVRFAVTDFVELTVPDGLVAKACDSRDIRCENPIIDDVVPDAEGYLEFENLPHGFRGYTVVSAPGYVDSLIFSNKPYAEDSMPEGPTVLTPKSLREIAEGGGEEIDSEKGIVIVTAHDCLGNAAPGVTLLQEDEENEEPAFYFEGTLPDRERTETTISTQLVRSMAPVAAGGFSQVDPGYVTLVGVLAETGEPIGRVIVQVRALTMTFAEIHAGY